MDFSLRHAILFPLIFFGFFATPMMVEYMVRKYKVRLVGVELVALMAPVLAFVGFYKGDWETGIFGMCAWAGLWLGFWYVWRRGT